MKRCEGEILVTSMNRDRKRPQCCTGPPSFTDRRLRSLQSLQWDCFASEGRPEGHSARCPLVPTSCSVSDERHFQLPGKPGGRTLQSCKYTLAVLATALTWPGTEKTPVVSSSWNGGCGSHQTMGSSGNCERKYFSMEHMVPYWLKICTLKVCDIFKEASIWSFWD